MDITDQKKAERMVHELNRDLEKRIAERTAQVERANKELETFTYSVSHDLRTPLRAIDGFSRILLEDYETRLDDEGKRILNIIRSNTNRMSALIDAILHFSRTGRAEMNYVRTDMNKLVGNILETMRAVFKENSVIITTGDLPPVDCDPQMMQQIFENLIGNAVKFSSKVKKPKIEINGKMDNENCIYYVKDNGIGYDMEYTTNLFGMFQRLHSMDEFEGTGIGLAVVKQIVDRHHGKVWAKSKPGKGATFYISIPQKEESDNEDR